MYELKLMFMGGIITCFSLAIWMLIHNKMKANRLSPNTIEGANKLAKALEAKNIKDGKIEVKNSWGWLTKDILITGVNMPILNMSSTVHLNCHHGVQPDWQMDLTVSQARDFHKQLLVAIHNAELEIEDYSEYCRRMKEDGKDGNKTGLSDV